MSTMTDDEINALLECVHDFEDCGETSVPYKMLMRLESHGLLECIHFNVTEKGQEAYEAAKENYK
jgi:DNA-binding PadR family transcriptional regulator